MARIIFVIFVIFKFLKISPWKSLGIFFTDIAILHVWVAVYCNSNSKKKLRRVTENILLIKRGNVVFIIFAY